MQIHSEFERQTTTLLQKGYPKAAGMNEEAFLQWLEPLKKHLHTIPYDDVDLEKGLLPFVIVIKSVMIPTETLMTLVEKDGKQGITKLYPHTPKDFTLIAAETVPDKNAYLLVAIDRGKETINIPPQEALHIIKKQHRSPLTIDEGVAIVTHFPEFLMKNNCFSLLASRKKDDKRVPAIWLNGQKHPNLGWCWDGNPHTWLGSASCKTRTSA